MGKTARCCTPEITWHPPCARPITSGRVLDRSTTFTAEGRRSEHPRASNPNGACCCLPERRLSDDRCSAPQEQEPSLSAGGALAGLEYWPRFCCRFCLLPLTVSCLHLLRGLPELRAAHGYSFLSL